MRMQTCRRTELLQMLGVTTSGSHNHVGSQPLGEVCHRLVDVFLWQLFPDGLQGDFQLIGRLRLRLEFMVLFQHGTQIWQSSGFKSAELESHSVFSINPFAFIHFCTMLAHWERGVVLAETHNSVIFLHIKTKLGDKVYIWLFDSHVKFHAKIFTHSWNINKSRRGATFLCSPGRSNLLDPQSRWCHQLMTSWVSWFPHSNHCLHYCLRGCYVWRHWWRHRDRESNRLHLLTGVALISISWCWAGNELRPSVMDDRPHLFYNLPWSHTGTKLYRLLTEAQELEPVTSGS